MRTFEFRKAGILGGIFLLLSGTPLRSQECAGYFPLEEGTVLKYVNYDKKDKVTGSYEMTFRNKQQTANGMIATFGSKFMDDEGEVLLDNDMEMECRNGALYFDAGQLLDPATMSAYESMEVEVSGDKLELPLDGTAGKELPDGGVKAVISSGGMKVLTITIDVSNRKIEGKETVRTPAGSFECIKYSSDALSKIGFIKVEVSSVEWYNEEYGTIRSESYDKKGKLTGYTVLESVSR